MRNEKKYTPCKAKVALWKAMYYCGKPFRILDNLILKKKCPFLFLYDNEKYPEYSWLDQMPKGWKRKFGKKMAMEIQRVIEEDGLTDYRITQVKEKYGSLRWYDEGGNDRTYEIIDRYEDISMVTCIKTGLPAKWMSTGWVCPYSTIAKVWLQWTEGRKFTKLDLK